MKITSVELHPHNSAFVATLSFRDPSRANPYNVTGMTGLDPDVVVPRFYGTSGTGGGKFYDFTPEKRDIVMLIDLNPQFAVNQSFSDLRDALYKAISSSRSGQMQIQFKDDVGVVAVISGLVTKFETPQFTKKPQVQITISTTDPFLKSPAPVAVAVGGLNPANTNIQDLVSTAPHGFDFVMAFTGAVASLVITDPTVGLPAADQWNFTVTPAGGFLNGDVLTFSSDPQGKQLYMVRGGVTIYLADKVIQGSVWPVIFPGDNHFAFATPANMHFNSISYYQAYWGV